jgi:septal ring factor EnvC (AmiA/AmiB activator)
MNWRSLYYFSLIILCGLGLFLNLNGQVNTAKQADQTSINQIQKSIDQTNQLLTGSKEERKQLLKRLDLLQSQIIYRKELKEKFASELQSTQSEIQELKKQNESSIELLKILEREYSQLLKNKLIHRLTYNPILTLIHPGEMDEGIKRWYLLEKVERERQQTLKNLQAIKSSYHQSLAKLTAESNKQDSLLKSVGKEEQNILSDISNSKTLINDLNSKESGLNAELIAYKKKKDEMSKLIEASMKNISNTKEKNKLSTSVSKIKYPLKESTIISRFGKNMDGGKSKLLIRNNGIDLQSKNPFVSVSAGAEVVEIRKMPNQSYLLITRTGNLFIVYSNLENVLLRNGEKVEQGVNLGKAARNEEGFYELHFETWIEKTPLDPMQFLK